MEDAIVHFGAALGDSLVTILLNSGTAIAETIVNLASLPNSSDKTMKIAITGVSGHLGSLIAKHVLRRSQNAVVHGICRNPDKLPTQLSSHDRFKTFQTGHDDAQKLRAALKGTDIAIFATLADHTTMRDGQKAVIDACIDEGVPRYMAGDWYAAALTSHLLTI